MAKEISITSFSQVRRIVDAAAGCERDVNLQDLQGAVADAKSILGLMNLDYSHPVKLTGDDPADVERIYKALVQ